MKGPAENLAKSFNSVDAVPLISNSPGVMRFSSKLIAQAIGHFLRLAIRVASTMPVRHRICTQKH